MDIYFSRFIIKPNKCNLLGELSFYVWMKANNAQQAMYEIQYRVETYDCEILKQALPLQPCTIWVFEKNKQYKEQFELALQKGYSNLFAVSDKRDLELVSKLVNKPTDFDFGHFYRTRNRLNKKGRCLHYDQGDACNEIIQAHSIQKSTSLKAISSDDNHVYSISGQLDKDGRAKLTKIGINQMSTFLGFCKYHDNEVFELIDNAPLGNSLKQVALYSYRSICREVFVKQNSLELYEKQLKTIKSDSREKLLIQDVLLGTKHGLHSLMKHKVNYDDMLSKSQFDTLKYIILDVGGDLEISFSGLLYPEFDFNGIQIQSLLNSNDKLSLITFCSAPTSKGWAIVFAWHSSDDDICGKFIDSLLEYRFSDIQLSNAIFRLIITCCENVAYSPSWVELLDSTKIDELCSVITNTSSPTIPMDRNHLASGLEGFVNWKFSTMHRH